jgi:hypothetical protein
MLLAIYINAGNTGSGNPRRGWIITNSDGEFIDFVDEGYEGNAALKAVYPTAVATSSIKVDPSVYRDAYRHSYGALDKQAKRENKLVRKRR